MRSSRSGNRRHLPTSPFKPPAPEPPVECFALQDLVNHDTYGLGHVIGVEDGIAVLVDFGERKVRITAPYAKLGKL